VDHDGRAARARLSVYPLRVLRMPGFARMRQTQQTKKKPATGLRPWLVFNCVLLQQLVKFD